MKTGVKRSTLTGADKELIKRMHRDGKNVREITSFLGVSKREVEKYMLSKNLIDASQCKCYSDTSKLLDNEYKVTCGRTVNRGNWVCVSKDGHSVKLEDDHVKGKTQVELKEDAASFFDAVFIKNDTGYRYPDGNPIHKNDMVRFQNGDTGFVFWDSNTNMYAVKSVSASEECAQVMSLNNAHKFIKEFIL